MNILYLRLRQGLGEGGRGRAECEPGPALVPQAFEGAQRNPF